MGPLLIQMQLQCIKGFEKVVEEGGNIVVEGGVLKVKDMKVDVM